MEEERIKSALEIAMERISGLPELTPEEIAEQKEKQYGPIGEAIAGRYLNGMIGEDEIREELGKYQGEQFRIIVRSFLSCLCKAIRIDDGGVAAGRALNGISRMAPENERLIDRAREDFRSILEAFEREKQTMAAELQAETSETLKRLGISGTAVRLNLGEHEGWRNGIGRLLREYESKLETLRSGLLQSVTSF